MIETYTVRQTSTVYRDGISPNPQEIQSQIVSQIVAV